MKTMKVTNTDTYQVMSDGRTVWVNSHKGWSLGRFSWAGIDVHHDFFSQHAGSECLDCKAGPTTLPDWQRFKDGMLRFHGVVVTDDHVPSFLGEEIARIHSSGG